MIHKPALSAEVSPGSGAQTWQTANHGGTMADTIRSTLVAGTKGRLALA